MTLNPLGRARTAEARRVILSEQAVAELDRHLSVWDAQREALLSDGLGSDPLRHVPRTWPIRESADASATARTAAPLTPPALAAEISALGQSGVGKLIGAGVSVTLVLSIAVALILNAVGG